jgi:Rieske Fe-S protein
MTNFRPPIHRPVRASRAALLEEIPGDGDRRRRRRGAGGGGRCWSSSTRFGASAAAARPRSVPVAPLDALPADGTPQRFQVIADRADAWTKYRNVPLGAVYLKRTRRRRHAGSVVAFNALCPHAGCFVDVAADGKSFHCPCHNSGFNADGSLKPGAVSPRPLDTAGRRRRRTEAGNGSRALPELRRRAPRQEPA